VLWVLTRYFPSPFVPKEVSAHPNIQKKADKKRFKAHQNQKKRGRTVTICYLRAVQSGNTSFMGWLKAYQKILLLLLDPYSNIFRLWRRSTRMTKTRSPGGLKATASTKTRNE
jgi:hypothetical protein